MLHRYIFVAHALGFVLGVVQRVVEVLTNVLLPALGFHLFVQRMLQAVLESAAVDAHFIQELRDQTTVLVQQRVEQMFLLDLLIAEVHGDLLQIVDGFHGFFCKSINLHVICLLTDQT